MQKISFKMVNSTITQEQTKTVNRIQALLSRCQNETMKIFENSKQKRSCHWISSLRQCQNVLELCLGELCGMLASTGFAIVGDTINLLQLVQKTNFEYLLKGYMLLFKRWESDAETNIEVKPQTTKAPIGIKHFAKDELKTVNSLQFYRQQKELEKKRPKILLRNSKTVANLGIFDGKQGGSELKPIQEQQNQANQEDSSGDSEGEGNSMTKIQNSLESGFVLLQKIRQEDQEFLRNVEAILNKKKAVPESKMPLVMNQLDEVLQTFGDANEDFEMMDETVGQQLQKLQELIKEAKTIKTEETAEFQLDFSPRGLADNSNENGIGIDLIRDDEPIEKNKDIAKLKEDIRNKNDTILDLKTSLKEKDALIKEIEMQNKHYIFLSTQLRIDLKGLKMVFDEESDKLVQERQKKNDAEAKLAILEQTTDPNNYDNIRLVLEKMTLEVENNHLNERIMELENEMSPKTRKVTKVTKAKLVRDGKGSQSPSKEKNPRRSSIDNFIEKEDLKTETIQQQRTSSKIENDPLSFLSREFDQPEPEKIRTADCSPIIQPVSLQPNISQTIEPKLLLSTSANDSQLELKVSKSMQARNSLIDFKNIMQTQEDEEARIEQARKVTEENLKRTLIKGFAQNNTFKKRERSVEMRRPQVLTSREKEKYMLHRNASYGVIGVEDNLTGNFTERDNSKSRELPQINFSTTAGYDDSIQIQRAAETKAMLDNLLPTVDRKEKASLDKNYWGMVLRDPLRKNYKAHRNQSNDMYDTHLRPLDYSEISGYPGSHSSRYDRELNVQSFNKIYGQSVAKWQLTEEDEVELPINKGIVTADTAKMMIIDLGHQREKEVRDLYDCLNQNAENVQVFILWIKEIAKLREDRDNVLTRLEAEVEFIQSLKTFAQFRDFYIKCIESHKDCGRDCTHVIKFRERIKVMISNKIKIKPKDKDKEKKKKKVHK